MASKNEEIVEGIRDAISSRRLLPGVQLREAGLCKVYGVSRTVVRQALQSLSREGLVDLTPGRIASVAKPTPKEARDVFDLRWAIESHATDTLSRSLTRKTITALRAHVRKERSARAANDAEAVRKLGAGFHVLLAELAGNELATRTLEHLVARVALILVLYRHHYDEQVECLQDEHMQFIDLLEAGESAKAKQLLRKHLQRVEVSLNMEEIPLPDDSHLYFALLNPA